MCNQWCLDFVKRCSEFWRPDATVLEVGSRNVNGSVRDVMPASVKAYTGVDIEAGPGVDALVSVYDLFHTYGGGVFDVVISTEMLEHVEDWRRAVFNMATVTKPGGWLIITTRSPGFEYHPYPLDCWRFTVEHVKDIFQPPIGLFYMETDPDLRKGRYSGVGTMAVRSWPLDLWRWSERLNAIQVTPAR